jgi:hypothetical protein
MAAAAAAAAAKGGAAAAGCRLARKTTEPHRGFQVRSMAPPRVSPPQLIFLKLEATQQTFFQKVDRSESVSHQSRQTAAAD